MGFAELLSATGSTDQRVQAFRSGPVDFVRSVLERLENPPDLPDPLPSPGWALKLRLGGAVLGHFGVLPEGGGRTREAVIEAAVPTGHVRLEYYLGKEALTLARLFFRASGEPDGEPSTDSPYIYYELIDSRTTDVDVERLSSMGGSLGWSLWGDAVAATASLGKLVPDSPEEMSATGASLVIEPIDPAELRNHLLAQSS